MNLVIIGCQFGLEHHISMFLQSDYAHLLGQRIVFLSCIPKMQSVCSWKGKSNLLLEYPVEFIKNSNLYIWAPIAVVGGSITNYGRSNPRGLMSKITKYPSLTKMRLIIYICLVKKPILNQVLGSPLTFQSDEEAPQDYQCD